MLLVFSLIRQPRTLAVDPEPQASRSMRRPDLGFALNKSVRPFGESHIGRLFGSLSLPKSVCECLVAPPGRTVRRAYLLLCREKCETRFGYPHVDVVQGTRSLLVPFLSLVGENYDADQR